MENIESFGYGILFIGLTLLTIIANWKIYTKAGQPGWASIIPIYNIVVLLKIVNKPLWWIILLIIPIINIVMAIIIMHELAKSFGKNIGFTIGLLVFPFIFYPILGFSDAVYTPPQNSENLI